MKKQLLLVLTVLLVSCSKQAKTVESAPEATTTPEAVESVKSTESGNSIVHKDAQDPEVQEILKESPNQFKGMLDEGVPSIDTYHMIYKKKYVDLDPSLGTKVYFVPVFGDYKNNDIVGIYEDEVTEGTVLESKKIIKAVIFNQKTEE